MLSTIPPLATDIYMPALPQMVDVLNTTTTLTSFTMVGSLAMFIGSQAWSSYVTGIAVTIFMFYIVALSIFFIALKRKVIEILLVL